jgi:hypothetical protein
LGTWTVPEKIKSVLKRMDSGLQTTMAITFGKVFQLIDSPVLVQLGRNYQWDGAVTDRFAAFGQTGDKHIVGKWS